MSDVTVVNNLDTEKLWRDTLESLRVSVSPANFTTWFSRTHLIGVSQYNNRIIARVGCPSGFVKSNVESRYSSLVREVLKKNTKSECEVQFEVAELEIKTEGTEIEAPLFESEKIKSELIYKALENANIRKDFTFDNFAVSGSNQMAWAAADAVSKKLGTSYNPLFIWGGVGVGKTHLMMAIGNRVIENNPSTSMLFCSAEEFTNHIVQGIRTKTTEAFRQRYRKRKLLFVDDIQFIAGKVTVQEEFFHTFNAITSAGGQIVLSSDRPPQEISKLEERLRSRFEAGLIVDISEPDFELRTAIVLIKSREKGINVTMEQAQMIAGNIDSARRIQGFLIKLMSELTIKKVQLSDELVQDLVGKGNGGDQMVKNIKRATTSDVIDAVSKYFSLGKRHLLGKSRSRSVAEPRQILMYLLRTDLGMPLEEVGSAVGGRDHTTVMHAVEKISRLLSSNVQIREDIVGIKKQL